MLIKSHWRLSEVKGGGGGQKELKWVLKVVSTMSSECAVVLCARDTE